MNNNDNYVFSFEEYTCKKTIDTIKKSGNIIYNKIVKIVNNKTKGLRAKILLYSSNIYIDKINSNNISIKNKYKCLFKLIINWNKLYLKLYINNSII